MSGEKPSTNDILASIRKKAGQPAGEGPAAEKPAAEAAKPAAAPSSTSDILAAARKAGTGKEEAAAAPASTADILAAARAKKAPAAATPAGTGDILAAIRGGGGAAKPAAAAPAGKPAAAKPAASPTGMSPEEMIAAARKGAKPAVQAKPKLPGKPLATKPPTTAKAGSDSSRRGFLGDLVAFVISPVVIAWGSFLTALGASSLGIARFMMPNVLVEPPTKFKIGPPTDYAAGTVSTKWKAQFGVWIVNADVEGEQLIYALSTVCTHLGCTPNWLEGEQKFKCPCHGSGFYKDGVNFEGPAPRPLERHAIRIAEDGMLEVDKSQKFQKELGQWENGACYVPV